VDAVLSATSAEHPRHRGTSTQRVSQQLNQQLTPPLTPGVLFSVAAPRALHDGRLSLLIRTAETGEPFVISDAGDEGRFGFELSGQLLSDGQVMLQVLDLDSEELLGRNLAVVKNRWERLIEDAPLGVIITNFKGVLLEANQSMCGLLGREAWQIIGHALNEFTDPDDARRLDRDKVLTTGRASMNKRYLRPGGEMVYLRISASLVVENGEPFILSICEDITAAMAARAELEYQATVDELTGMWNRPATRNLLLRSIQEMTDGQWPALSLLVLDIDRFKLINSSLGLEAGDALITHVAARLKSSIPVGTMIGRTSGDEFVVIAPGVGDPDGLAGAMMQALQAPILVQGNEVSVGACIGVVVARTSDLASDRPEVALLRDAHSAMQVAKRGGAGRIVNFDASLRRQAIARLESELDFRRALERDELVLFFQPIAAAANTPTDAGQEFEALIRWQHPDRGLLLPGEFLPIAQETGLMVEIGRTVIELACRQLVAWRTTRPTTRVAVNLAAEHIDAGTLTEDVFGSLLRHGLPASALILEVTEQTLLQAHSAAAAALGALRTAGARIAIDDFGTGYSSLVYLRDLPVDILKIDRTFVAGLGTPANDGTLFRAVVALSQSLRLQTVAEGIETEAELSEVVAAGVNYLQGFLLGRPQHATTMTE